MPAATTPPKVSAGGSERTWVPYFKVNVADANAVPPVFSSVYGEKWLRLTNCNIPAPSDWNGTNGEITTYQVEDADGNLCNIALQSLPLGLEEYQGDVRRNVGFYFKDITSPYSYQKAGKFPCATSKQTGDKTLFSFVGNPYTGYKIQNLALGEEKAVGAAPISLLPCGVPWPCPACRWGSVATPLPL